LSKSPAFGTNDNYISLCKNISFNYDEKKKMWGDKFTNLEDVGQIFNNYLSGKIKKFPFAEGVISKETSDISEILHLMNSNKMFTINSQPRVNGALSTDPVYGWGIKNGFIYQKSYIEFFIHPKMIDLLVAHLN